MTTTDRVLVASNRGPVWFADEDGELSPRRGSGGLVAALASAVQTTGGLWVSAAMGPGDRRRAAETPDGRMEVVVDDTKFGIRLLAFDPKTYDRAYNQVSNRILWFVHHRLWDLPRSPIFDTESRAAWEAYRRFSRSFAEALAQEVGALPATVLVQDYHLALVPAFLRAMAPQVRIAHFSHVPFADPDTLRLLPGPLWRELLTGMLGADLLGFHTERWADAFLACCRGLEETSVRGRTITREGRTSRVGVFPISIEAEGLRARAGSELVRHRRKELVRWRRDRALVLRVDRLDPSKNILRGFLAFEDLLRRRPGWRGRVVFLALLNPSRQGVPEYRAYAQECLAAAGRINGELGDRGWQPIDVRVNDDIDEVLAAYALYNVLMVNPVFDGMNLVAKEGPLLNRGDGVLLLSRNAGAFAELGRHALPVDPLVVAGTADALDVALRMHPDDRRARARALRRIAGASSPARWVERQLRELDRVTPTRATPRAGS